MLNDPGSFRDPSGKVYISDHDVVYRYVFLPGIADYEASKENGIYEILFNAGLLIGHEEISNRAEKDAEIQYCLKHPKLPMVSYPWEWSFSMLKDAALIHLDIMETIIPLGFWLRDANAFNVQFDGEKLVFIDTLSVGKRIVGSPWVAYGQFCSHFLAPLAMAAYCDVRLLSMWRSSLNGFPLDLAAKTLSIGKKIKPGLFLHLVLHSYFQSMADIKGHINGKRKKKRTTMSDAGLIGLIRSLRKTISNIQWKRSSAIWESYNDIRTYDSNDVSEKFNFVEVVIDKLKPDIVWDLGANTGDFSIIAASKGSFVVSIDGDPACTESLYIRLSQDRTIKNILPLTMDLSNPSPGIGWNNQERMSLNERGPADLVLALALVHHLVLSNNIPLSHIAQWFAQISRHLLVEFIPSDDPMVKKLVENRLDQHLPYSYFIFKESFEKYFTFIEEKPLRNGRSLFWFEKK
jgi:hypothetical protein